MGTSSSSSGPRSNTPLVPSWLDDGDVNSPPGGGNADEWMPGDQDKPEDDSDSQTRPPVPPSALIGRFRGARMNFSRFAGSGGGDKRALQRAVRDYVHNGMGGTSNAVKRMGVSRTATANALRLFRTIEHYGLQETLRHLNLEALAGHGVQDVFLGLTEVICQDGGLIDEAIVRDAWLETVAELDQFGIENLNSLLPEQIRALFLGFIAHSIVVRLYQDIGVNGFKFAKDLENIDSLDMQLRDYIKRGVHDSFRGDIAILSSRTDQDIQQITRDAYHDAWNLLKIWGDAEE